jgi:hypothetical protein
MKAKPIFHVIDLAVENHNGPEMPFAASFVGG